jgi:hypothetical protein
MARVGGPFPERASRRRTVLYSTRRSIPPETIAAIPVA